METATDFTFFVVCLDYLHLTKRIGAVAVSQLPLCLLLATKSKFSPLQIILGLSEQHLNSYHRILARLITCFVACHVALYVNFFIWNGLLSKRIRDADVLIGIAASCFLVIIGITCLETLRHRNYRVFFITHTVLGGLLFPLLYFHTHHLRPYMLESIAVYAANSLARYFNTRSLLARITFTPSSDLHVLIHLPGGETEASRYPTATHIYLGIPSQTSPVLNFLRKTLVKNPFTIANSPSDKALNLLIRPRDGVTARFAEMDIPNSSSPGLESMTPVLVEGPYGLSTKFTPSISAHLWETYDNVLFCAGGLGATFIMPTVMALLNQNEMREDGPRVKVKVILIMRTQREVDTILELFSKPEPGGSEACRTNLRDVLQIFLTRPSYDMEEDYSHATDLQSLLPEHGSHSIPLTTYQPNGEAHLGRPNWVRLLDEFFKNGRSQETTAVLSCGPDDMKIELRDTLELFVKDGMKIWWCEEKFGR